MSEATSAAGFVLGLRHVLEDAVEKLGGTATNITIQVAVVVPGRARTSRYHLRWDASAGMEAGVEVSEDLLQQM